MERAASEDGSKSEKCWIYVVNCLGDCAVHRNFPALNRVATSLHSHACPACAPESSWSEVSRPNEDKLEWLAVAVRDLGRNDKGLDLCRLWGLQAHSTPYPSIYVIKAMILGF
jgi:hypothetical protein